MLINGWPWSEMQLHIGQLHPVRDSRKANLKLLYIYKAILLDVTCVLCTSSTLSDSHTNLSHEVKHSCNVSTPFLLLSLASPSVKPEIYVLYICFCVPYLFIVNFTFTSLNFKQSAGRFFPY